MKKMLCTTLQPIRFKYLIVLIFVGVGISNSLQAQIVYKLYGAKENIVKIAGKSNIHDWTMTAENLACDANFGPVSGAAGVPKKLISLNFSVKSKNLKSESESMNNRTYKVIKADAYPDIDFKLREATISALQKNKFSVDATGTLTIAGVSKIITLHVNGEVNADHTILCTGQQKIKLTDYGIQPPSYMLGAMKVGNELTILFTLNFKK
ncbi:YceI family protein [Pedobacter hiemivivus]|uniref:YceI family protein n=1 Tax=Pedobacter hiemivivus TaxID=2530454 RepID=A0A4R0N0B7_9SPHI|nr:YceI family protein [Pedobacter hiemivivus]TCC93080.1 YceI family protein [Pedobacter hiemivivus]